MPRRGKLSSAVVMHRVRTEGVCLHNFGEGRTGGRKLHLTCRCGSSWPDVVLNSRDESTSRKEEETLRESCNKASSATDKRRESRRSPPGGADARGDASGVDSREEIDLTEVSIENLMNMEVMSVSKKEQKLPRTASAVFGITQEDIAQSRATNISGLLRMVPGMDVAQIASDGWAISAHGLRSFQQRASDAASQEARG
jgi:hypothetical protein